MASIADIVVFDGAATPVSHTLKAVDVSRERGKLTANWREASTTVPAYAQVTATVTLERLKSSVYKAEARVQVPVMESVSGQNSSGYTAAPKVAYTNTLSAVAFFHERSTITDRRLARQLLVNLLGNVSTSVAAATTGVAPDLFDSLVAPT